MEYIVGPHQVCRHHLALSDFFLPLFRVPSRYTATHFPYFQDSPKSFIVKQRCIRLSTTEPASIDIVRTGLCFIVHLCTAVLDTRPPEYLHCTDLFHVWYNIHQQKFQNKTLGDYKQQITNIFTGNYYIYIFQNVWLYF